LPQQLQELTTEVNKSSKRFGLCIKHEKINILLGRQGCNLSRDLFNMILEDMMKKALWNVKGGVAVDGLTVNNL